MADNETRIIFSADDNNLLDSLSKLEERVKTLDTSFEDLSKEQKKTFDSLGNEIKKANKSISSNTKKLEDNVESSQALEMQTKSSTSALGDFLGANTKIGASLKGTITSLRAKAASLKLVSASLSGTNKGLKAFRLALISTGIGAIVVALGSLVSFLTSTQEGMDKVTAVTRPLSVIFQRLVGVTQQLGKSLFEAFSNPLETLKSFGEGVKNFILNPFKTVKNVVTNAATSTKEFFEESIEQGTALDQKIKDIEKSEIALTRQGAKLRTEIKKQDLIIKDQTKSYAERESAARKSSKAQNELLKLETDFIDKKIAKIKLEQTFNDTSRVDLLELAKLEAERETKLQQGLQLSTKLTVALNSIQKQQQAEAKKLEDERLKRIKEINDEIERQNGLLNDQLTNLQARLDKVNFDSADSYEKLAITRQNAINEIRELERAILELGIATGKELNISEDIKVLLDSVEEQFAEGVKKQREADSPLVDFLPSIFDKEFEVDLPEIKISDESKKRAAQNLGDVIQDLFSLSDGDLQALESTLDSVTKIANEIFDAQIAKQDAIINKIDERIAKQQELVDEESRLDELGLANSLGTEKAKLDGLEKERSAAEKKRQKALIAQAKVELATNAAQTVSSIILMSAQLAASEASKGIAGIATLSIAIAGFLSLLASVKNIANQEKELRLYDGGQIAPHLSDDRVGEGLRIEGTNIKVGGGEFVSNKKSTSKNLKFLKRLNNHEFDDIDLEEMIDYNQNRVQNINDNQTIIANHKSDIDYRKMEKIYEKQITRLIVSNESRPLIYPNGSYTEVINNNGSIQRKTVR